MTGVVTDLLFVACTNHEVAVLAGEDLVRDDGRMRCAVAPRLLASNEVV